MRNFLNAGKTLALGGAVLAASALAYLHFGTTGPRSSDPYDNLEYIGVGANAGVLLLIGILVDMLALPLLLAAAAGHRGFRTRTTMYWLLATLASPAALLAVLIFR
jgi:hypothetical protein